MGSFLIDVLGTSDTERLVVILGTVAIVLLICAQTANFGAFFVLNRVVAAAQTRIGHDVVARCLNAPYPWFLARDFSKLSRVIFDDVTRWAQQFLGQLVGLIASLGTFAVAVGILLTTVSWQGVGLLVVISLLSFATMRGLRPLVFRFGRRERLYSDELFSLANQLMASIKDVKLSSRERAFNRLMDIAFSNCSLARVKQNLTYQAPPLILVMMGQIFLVGFALLLWAGGTASDQIAAQMTVLLLVTSRVVPLLSRVSSHLSQLWGVSTYIEGLLGILTSTETGIVQTGQAPLPEWSELQIESLSFHYPGSGAKAIDNVSARFCRGGVHGIVGPSGAGKSTLVDLMFGLLRPTFGSVRLDGRELAEIDEREWRTRIGYVPQFPFIFNDTLGANVAFGVSGERIDTQRVIRSLEMASLGDLLASLPKGLQTPLGDRGSRLSGGQRQRVALARALYRNPDLLVLDEATSALDAANEGAILQTVLSLRGHVTVLIITHRLNLLRDADSILVLAPDAPAQQGDFATLLASSEIFRTLMTSSGDKETSESLPTTL